MRILKLEPLSQMVNGIVIRCDSNHCVGRIARVLLALGARPLPVVSGFQRGLSVSSTQGLGKVPVGS